MLRTPSPRLLVTAFLTLAACRTTAERPDELSRAFGDLGSQLRASLKDVDTSPRVAVLPFTDQAGHAYVLGNYVAEKLATALGKDGTLTLIERSRLEQVMRELELSTSNAISDDSAVSLGRLLGAHLIVMGTFTDLGETIDFDCRMVEAESGRIRAAASVVVPRTEAIDRLYQRIDAPARDAGSGAASAPSAAPAVPAAAGVPAASAAAPAPAGPRSLVGQPRKLTTVGWGTLVENASYDGSPLVVGGVKFASGFFAHAESTLTFELDGAPATFTAKIGVADSGAACYGPGGSGDGASFTVEVDGARRYESPVVRPGDSARTVEVDVTGARLLTLRTHMGPNGYCDHTVWLEPTVRPR